MTKFEMGNESSNCGFLEMAEINVAYHESVRFSQLLNFSWNRGLVWPMIIDSSFSQYELYDIL